MPERRTIQDTTIEIKSNNLGENIRGDLIPITRASPGIEKVERDGWFEWETRNTRTAKS